MTVCDCVKLCMHIIHEIQNASNRRNQTQPTKQAAIIHSHKGLRKITITISHNGLEKWLRKYTM